MFLIMDLVVTASLNTSLHTQSQTFALIALQKATHNLPPHLQLISPGRSFVKRGSMDLFDLLGQPSAHEFLLFSDIIIWLKSESAAHDPLSGKTGPQLGFLSPSVAQERWSFKGLAQLIDVDIILPVSPTVSDPSFKIEIFTPEKSFEVACGSVSAREDWAAAIRSAKCSLLISLNAIHPNSTLTSSTSTHHLRKSLQALPYTPEEEVQGKPKRGKVEHFVPAIWIPDAKADVCMRCSNTFNWRRRRHHCRLCGRCVCANCSGRVSTSPYIILKLSKHALCNLDILYSRFPVQPWPEIGTGM